MWLRLRGRGDRERLLLAAWLSTEGLWDPSTAQQCVPPGVRGATCSFPGYTPHLEKI